MDVLQYSQKDLDSAVEATQKENEVLRGKCAALQEAPGDGEDHGQL